MAGPFSRVIASIRKTGEQCGVRVAVPIIGVGCDRAPGIDFPVRH